MRAKNARDYYLLEPEAGGFNIHQIRERQAKRCLAKGIPVYTGAMLRKKIAEMKYEPMATGEELAAHFGLEPPSPFCKRLIDPSPDTIHQIATARAEKSADEIMSTLLYKNSPRRFVTTIVVHDPRKAKSDS